MPDKNVEVPGLGVVSFPDSMSDDQINSAIKAQLSSSSQQPSNYSKLTAGYNPDVEDWAQKHPIAGPIIRFLDATGGAALNTPEAIVKGIRDVVKMAGRPGGAYSGEPTETEKALSESAKGWADPKIREGALSVLPEALGVGAGSVAGGEMAGAAAAKVPAVSSEVLKGPVNSLRQTAMETFRDPATGKVRTPYEVAVDKILPDPYKPQATPAKSIPKGTNYGQYLEEQKVAAKAAAKQQAADASNPAGQPLTPGGKIVDPNSAPLPLNKTYVSHPRLLLVKMAKTGDMQALRELVRNPGNVDLDQAVPNWKFLIDRNAPGVVYGGPDE